jgi:hypothetical protein
VWDPVKLQPTTIHQNSGVRRQQQHKVWDPRGIKKVKTCDQEVMKHSNPRSLMQEHPASENQAHLTRPRGLCFL